MSDKKAQEEKKPIQDETLDKVSGGHESGVPRKIAPGPPPMPRTFK